MKKPLAKVGKKPPAKAQKQALTEAQPLPGIEHVVVLMLENRSFDNVLGGLYPQLTRRGLYRGLLGNETNPRNPANPAAGSVTVFQGPASSPTWIMPYPDPGELYADMVQQIFGSRSVLPCSVPPPMSGFAWNYTQQKAAPAGNGWPAVSPVAHHVMQYYSDKSMPISHRLAQSYAVCDCWFAAAPVQTIANRVLAHCGTPSKIPGKNQSRVNNPDYTPDFDKFPPQAPVSDKTIFELLDEKWPQRKSPDYCWEEPTPHLNWKVYYHDAPLSALCKYVHKYWCYDSPYGGNVFNFNRFDGGTNFEHDIASKVLPTYSFIEPRYTNFFDGTVNSNHPGGAGIDCDDPNGDSLPPPVSVVDGENLLWEVYSILARHPETFAKTLLIVTYDEHGGLFDHVPPPCAVSALFDAGHELRLRPLRRARAGTVDQPDDQTRHHLPGAGAVREAARPSLRPHQHPQHVDRAVRARREPDAARGLGTAARRLGDGNDPRATRGPGSAAEAADARPGTVGTPASVLRPHRRRQPRGRSLLALQPPPRRGGAETPVTSAEPAPAGRGAPRPRADALVDLGVARAARGRPLEAAAAFQNALRLDAEHVPALLNLGSAWRHLGHPASALPCYKLAVKLAPERADTHYLLGTLLCQDRDLDGAVAAHRRALELEPDHAGALSDLGSALVLQGDLDEGPELLRRAVELAPDWPVALVNLGVFLVRERRWSGALAAFRAAQAADPRFVYARFCESNFHLLLGDYARGYALYDAHRAVYPHRYRERRWEGGPLAGRTILLYAQHGLGDTLQFVRYVPRVAELGGRVVLQVQPAAAAVARTDARRRPRLQHDRRGRPLRRPGVAPRAAGDPRRHARDDPRRGPLPARRCRPARPLGGPPGERPHVQGGHRLARQPRAERRSGPPLRVARHGAVCATSRA